MTKQPQIKSLIEDLVSKHQVVVFAKSWCTYCNQTKALMQSAPFRKVDVHFLDLDLIKDGPAIQSQLKAMTGQRTVPSVWVNGKFLGGNDDSQRAWRNGQLMTELAIEQ